MVDFYGNWTAEKNYSKYPEDKWCDYDYVATWVMEMKYSPKTTIENLVKMIVAHYDTYLSDNNIKFYTDIEESENEPMISVKDVASFVMESGGYAEFDYWC